jgi:hypothetical protein
MIMAPNSEQHLPPPRPSKRSPVPPPPPVAGPASPIVVAPAQPHAAHPPSPAAQRRHRSRVTSQIATIVLLLVAGGVGAAFYAVWPREPVSTRLIARIESRHVDELTDLVVPIEVLGGEQAPPVTLTLKESPPGMLLDAEKRLITWRPTEADGPDRVNVVIHAEATDGSGRTDMRQFLLQVNEVNQPPVVEPIEDRSIAQGETVEFIVAARDDDEPPDPLRYRLTVGASLGATIDAETGQFRWYSGGSQPGVHPFEVRVTEGVRDGLSASQKFSVTVTAPERVAAEPVAPPTPAPVETAPVAAPPPEQPVVEDLAAEDEKAILALYAANRLLDRREYPALRKLYARRFERDHLPQIQEGLGADYEKVMAWLNSNNELKEELYTAIDPAADNVPRVFRLIGDLIEKYPAEVAEYGELAIATAVVWDKERAVYDYGHHQARTKSTMPDGLMTALDNFNYLAVGDKVLQRVRYLPWEFLVHVVDHKTPMDDRRWAVVNYLPFRAMFGRCYGDVPYDTEMLDSGSERARMNGKPYTLPNLKTFGGVCAMQADFASRVGKCLAVPAAYVSGEARSGDRHAWVMWVELKSVTKDNIAFSLESHGRYSGDRYYVGTLEDPHTGKGMTDRQLEVRLHTVGMNPLAKRQASMVMRAFPMLREKNEMDVKTELAFLNSAIQFCPGSEDAWRAVAQISRDDRVEKPQFKAMMLMVDKLFITFAAFPDFTWEVFDDLIAFQKDGKQRGLYYARLVGLYEQASRPDLACEARLKYADDLIAEKRFKEAVEGLAFTVKKFPDEGRYVPRLLDKLEVASADLDKNGEGLVRFYQEFLPLVPATRGERPSPYCIAMHQRAMEVFRKHNRADLAQMCEMRIRQLDVKK